MTGMHLDRIAAAALAAVFVACSDPASAPAGRAVSAAEVEHATVVRGRYELTVYPGWASAARLRRGGGAPLELYRGGGAYRLPEGERAPSAWHEVRLRGGPEGRDVAVEVHDPLHAMAAIRLRLRRRGAVAPDGGEDTLEVQNIVRICPPDCAPPGMSIVPGRRLLPVRGGEGRLPGRPVVREGGYELALGPGFAGRAELRTRDGGTRELFRGEAPPRLPAGSDAPAHGLVLRGGPVARDLALRVEDPGREVAGIELELHAPGYIPGSGRAAPPVEKLVVGGAP